MNREPGVFRTIDTGFLYSSFSFLNSSFHLVGVAQLAERLSVKQEVAGSIPVTHPRM